MKTPPYVLTFVAVAVIWQFLAGLLGDGVLPAPAVVAASFGRELASADFRSHALASLGRAGAGIALGFMAAFPLGLWLGASRRADRWLSPFLFLTYPLPKILLLPILLVMLGLGEAPKIILIALTCGYQILMVTRDGLRNLDPSYLLSFQAISRAGRKKMPGRVLSLARHVLVPAVLPASLTALRLATGTAVAVLFMAESFATDRGLGFMIMEAWGGLDLPRMFSGIVAMCLMGLLIYILLEKIERRLCRWTDLRR